MATIPKAGHMSPGDNYEAVKSMVDDFILKGELQCNECSVADTMCKAMNNCNQGGGCLPNG